MNARPTLHSRYNDSSRTRHNPKGSKIIVPPSGGEPLVTPDENSDLHNTFYDCYTPPDVLFYDHELDDFPSSVRNPISVRSRRRSRASRPKHGPYRLLSDTSSNLLNSADLELPPLNGNDEISRSFLNEQASYERIRSRYPFSSSGAEELCSQSLYQLVEPTSLVEPPIAVPFASEHSKRRRNKRRLVKDYSLALNYAVVAYGSDEWEACDSLKLLCFGTHCTSVDLSSLPNDEHSLLSDSLEIAVCLGCLEDRAMRVDASSALIEEATSSFVVVSDDSLCQRIYDTDEMHHSDRSSIIRVVGCVERTANDRDLFGYASTDHFDDRDKRPLPAMHSDLGRLGVCETTGYDLFEWWKRNWNIYSSVVMRFST